MNKEAELRKRLYKVAGRIPGGPPELPKGWEGWDYDEEEWHLPLQQVHLTSLLKHRLIKVAGRIPGGPPLERLVKITKKKGIIKKLKDWFWTTKAKIKPPKAPKKFGE